MAPWTSASIEDFLKDRRRYRLCRPATLKIYRKNLHAAQRACGAFDEEALGAYWETLQARLSPASLHQHYRTLRTFFKWAMEAGMLVASPFKVKMGVPKTKPKPCDEGVPAALVEACGNTWEGVRNASLLYCYADSGLRRTEALKRRIRDVNLRDGLILVGIDSKTKDEEYAQMGYEHVKAMRRWLALRHGAHPEDLLYCKRDGSALHPDYVSHLLYRLCDRAGLEQRWAPHSFRHYVGTYIWRRTGDVKLIQSVLRHKSPEMAMRYMGADAADIRRKFRTISPGDNWDA